MPHRPVVLLCLLLLAGVVGGVLLVSWKHAEGRAASSLPVPEAGRVIVIGAQQGVAVKEDGNATTPSPATVQATRELQTMQRFDATAPIIGTPRKREITENASSDFKGIALELVRTRALATLPAPVENVPREEIARRLATGGGLPGSAEEGARFGRALAALGVIPSPVETHALGSAFLSHQIGAVYDPAQDVLLLATETSAEGAKENALGIAYGNLARHFQRDMATPHDAKLTTDARLARECLLAGDASLTRLLHATEHPDTGGGGGAGEDPDDPSRTVPIPNFLRELALQPFGAGLRFVQALHSVGGFDEVDAAYQKPPSTCLEVWHPSVYLGEVARGPLLPATKAPVIGNAEPFWQDTFGVIGVMLYLKQFMREPEAVKAVDGWSDDRLLVYPAAGGTRDHAVWLTKWRDASSADSFATALEANITRRCKGTAMRHGADGTLRWDTGTRVVVMKKSATDATVQLIDAADGAFADAALARITVAP